MRILIGGEDDVCLRLAEELMGEHEVVLVCGQEASRSRLERLDARVVVGSLSSLEVLREGEAGSAQLVVACAREDETNLVACVMAKRLGAARTVCFLHRQEYLRSTARAGETLAAAFGIDRVIWPAELLAREIVRIVTVPGALDVEIFEDGKVRMRKYAVDARSAIAGRMVREAGLPPGVVLVGLRRGDAMLLPRGDTRLEAGDRVIAMGDLRGLRRLAAELLPRDEADREGGPVTIVGGGSVGTMVATGLESAGGFRVKVIESERARCDALARLLTSSLLLCGDGTDVALLEDEHVEESRVLVAVTNRDERNLLVSLLGKQLGIPRIVTRADRLENVRLFERVGIDVVRSAGGAAIQAVTRGLAPGKRDWRAEVEHGDARVIEEIVRGDFPAAPLRDLHLPVFAIVGAIMRGTKTIIPRGEDGLAPGDRVLVFCDRASEATARRFFGGAGGRGG